MTHVELATELSDGGVTIRPAVAGDQAILIAGRDAVFQQFMGAGSAEPEPWGIVLNSRHEVVGWVDYDLGRSWLESHEANLGYNTFPEFRGQGFARRALLLLLIFLAEHTEVSAATLLIDPENAASIAVGKRAGFLPAGEVDGELLFRFELDEIR